MDIKIKDILGVDITIEDAILLREIIKSNFEGIDRVPSTFLNLLLGDLIISFGRDFIFEQVSVKNLSNYKDYSRVVLGTTFN